MSRQMLIIHNCFLTRKKDIAAYVKKEFDKKYKPTWRCIVGRNFGSYSGKEKTLYTCKLLRRKWDC
uniref:Dynein light chain n=1 Tax=Xiphophorus maculatus TaxID=8083 RepID=A0A3B5QSA6_XIPMA